MNERGAAWRLAFMLLVLALLILYVLLPFGPMERAVPPRLPEADQVRPSTEFPLLQEPGVEAPDGAAERIDAVVATSPSTSSAGRLEHESERKHTSVLGVRARAELENWETLYAALSRREMLSASEAIEEEILAETREYMEGEFAAGRVEVFDESDPVLQELRRNPFSIAWTRFESGTGRVMRVELPVGGFEDVLARRELSIWLTSRANGGSIAGLPAK